MTDPVEDERPTAPRALPCLRLSGNHRSIGRALGEQARERVQAHLEVALAALAADGLSRARVNDLALEYRPFVRDAAPGLDEEVVGLAEGAGLTVGEAYALQLRAELRERARRRDPECSCFVALSPATRDRRPLLAQNADLPAAYRELLLVVELTPPAGPPVLMVTAAGQVSYLGVNGAGLAVGAAFVTCPGWRPGFPRYLLTRVALRERRAADAVAAVTRLARASSRALLLVDAGGEGEAVELTPSDQALLPAEEGVLAHTNHFLAPRLQREERLAGQALRNSQARLARLRELLHAEAGALDVAACQRILRDREGPPHALCRAPGDAPGEEVATVVSLVAEPVARRLWVAPGPPHQHAYQDHELSG